MKVLLLILTCVFWSLFISCSKSSEPKKAEHFIVGEWQSVIETDPNIDNNSKHFLVFQPDKKVRVYLRTENRTIEENIYDYEVVDENTVKVDYIKPLEIRKTRDNLYIETECKVAYKSPPILCFNFKFEKVK